MIPDWNIFGALPPVRPGVRGASRDRAPYIASLLEVVQRFAISTERVAILAGLLAYRRELRARGVSQGFQWLDGSFVENKEGLVGESPKDIDVITFFALPIGLDQVEFAKINSDLFSPDLTKAAYQVDGYGFALGDPMDATHVRQLSYWYSMWSHRRNGMWKGFVQVDMSSSEDMPASDLLVRFGTGGAT